MNELPIEFSRMRDTVGVCAVVAKVQIGALIRVDPYMKLSEADNERIEEQLRRMVYKKVYGDRCKEAAELRYEIMRNHEFDHKFMKALDRLCELASAHP
jgi:hypothetical protein